ncbi:probable 28S rRNA (cytosine-C(5))-methyltransferase [Sipha flava]|uniref:Probable 28S rRNA (Cytosine-C(5))-methyltransferase n=1 Tax=Sipha flava TaxID=143950 RepID=A0A8B8G3C0_9HEMI|nr:probable 28S rRNA (cytosine-C(5))-methyltransferase [Sipha flava]
MVNKQSIKPANKDHDKTTGLYKIAAKIVKKVKSGSNYKSQLYQAQYPNKLLLNAVLMNVFKWEKVIDVLIEKSNILEKENNMDRELAYVLITELMWSKFGLKGSAKNIMAVKKYKSEFLKLMEENDLKNLTTSLPPKVWKPRFFRVNTLLTTLEDVLKKLSDLKFKKFKTPKTYAEFLELIKSDKFKGNCFVIDIHIKDLLVFNSKVKFYNLEDYNNGLLIVQDKASCLAAHLLNPEPDSTVLDMCAAPGMKTSHLAALMQNKGKLYAVDRCKERFNVLQNILEKYGVKNVETFNMDALTFPYYDDVKYILVDPSCSGSGIVDRVRNDPTLKNEHFKKRLKKLANVHAQLLNHALKSYPNLKRLVYSTCSTNPEENEAVVDEALSVNGKFKLLNCTKMLKGWTNKGAPGYDCSEMCLNAVSNVDCTNGFFIAVFVCRDFEEAEEEEDKKEVKKIEEEDEEEKIEEKYIIDSKKLKKTKANKNSLQSVNIKDNTNTPIKKSKNVKRRERRLKLEQAKGISNKTKKPKKVKTEEI